MSQETIANITAAPVELKLTSGRTVNVKPFDLSQLGKWERKFVDLRVQSVHPISEVLQGLKGHPQETILAVLDDSRRQLDTARNPPLNETLNWLSASPPRMVEIVCDCVIDDNKPVISEVALAMQADESFIGKWMVASGLSQENPTQPQ